MPRYFQTRGAYFYIFLLHAPLFSNSRGIFFHFPSTCPVILKLPGHISSFSFCMPRYSQTPGVYFFIFLLHAPLFSNSRGIFLHFPSACPVVPKLAGHIISFPSFLPHYPQTRGAYFFIFLLHAPLSQLNFIMDTFRISSPYLARLHETISQAYLTLPHYNCSPNSPDSTSSQSLPIHPCEQ